MQEIIRELKQALEKMTPGPWTFEKREREDERTIHYCLRTVDKLPAHPWSERFIAFMCGCLGEMIPNRKPADYRDDTSVEADAAGIVTLRNLLPLLLEKLEKQQSSSSSGDGSTGQQERREQSGDSATEVDTAALSTAEKSVEYSPDSPAPGESVSATRGIDYEKEAYELVSKIDDMPMEDVAAWLRSFVDRNLKISE